jgi:hypothetical protein
MDKVFEPRRGMLGGSTMKSGREGRRKNHGEVLEPRRGKFGVRVRWRGVESLVKFAVGA